MPTIPSNTEISYLKSQPFSCFACKFIKSRATKTMITLLVLGVLSIAVGLLMKFGPLQPFVNTLHNSSVFPTSFMGAGIVFLIPSMLLWLEGRKNVFSISHVDMSTVSDTTNTPSGFENGN